MPFTFCTLPKPFSFLTSPALPQSYLDLFNKHIQCIFNLIFVHYTFFALTEMWVFLENLPFLPGTITNVCYVCILSLIIIRPCVADVSPQGTFSSRTMRSFLSLNLTEYGWFHAAPWVVFQPMKTVIWLWATSPHLLKSWTLWLQSNYLSTANTNILDDFSIHTAELIPGSLKA